ncbi:hypothetical protein [Paenarthrobacter sp. NPDC089316]
MEPPDVVAADWRWGAAVGRNRQHKSSVVRSPWRNSEQPRRG